MSMVLVPVSTETLNKLFASRQNPQESLDAIIARHSASEPAASQPKMPAEKSDTLTALPFGRYKVALLGEHFKVLTLADALMETLRRLHDLDDTILDKLSHEGGRTRPVVAHTPADLYPGRSDLRKYARRLPNGWWVGTNYSSNDVKRIFRIICRVTGLNYGEDLLLA